MRGRQARADRKAHGPQRGPVQRDGRVVAVTRQATIILATGHQRHYSILYDNAVEQIRQGLIGEVHYIRAQWHRDNLPGNDSWSRRCPTVNAILTLRNIELVLASWATDRVPQSAVRCCIGRYWPAAGKIRLEQGTCSQTSTTPAESRRTDGDQ